MEFMQNSENFRPPTISITDLALMAAIVIFIGVSAIILFVSPIKSKKFKIAIKESQTSTKKVQFNYINHTKKFAPLTDEDVDFIEGASVQSPQVRSFSENKGENPLNKIHDISSIPPLILKPSSNNSQELDTSTREDLDSSVSYSIK